MWLEYLWMFFRINRDSVSRSGTVWSFLPRDLVCVEHTETLPCEGVWEGYVLSYFLLVDFTLFTGHEGP
jgi:hypothetical protein